MASITAGTSCPLASGAKFLTSHATTSAPTTGAAPLLSPRGPGGVKRVGVVGENKLTKEENVVDESDQHPKPPSAHAGDQADRDRHEQHEQETARGRRTVLARVRFPCRKVFALDRGLFHRASCTGLGDDRAPAAQG